MNGSQTRPFVSIITPAYNRESLIEETILSVIGQDYSYLEYLVLDDGSSDDTLSVIEKYAKHLRYETHPNMGETRDGQQGPAHSPGRDHRDRELGRSSLAGCGECRRRLMARTA